MANELERFTKRVDRLIAARNLSRIQELYESNWVKYIEEMKRLKKKKKPLSGKYFMLRDRENVLDKGEIKLRRIMGDKYVGICYDRCDDRFKKKVRPMPNRERTILDYICAKHSYSISRNIEVED